MNVDFSALLLKANMQAHQISILCVPLTLSNSESDDILYEIWCTLFIEAGSLMPIFKKASRCADQLQTFFKFLNFFQSFRKCCILLAFLLF